MCNIIHIHAILAGNIQTGRVDGETKIYNLNLYNNFELKNITYLHKKYNRRAGKQVDFAQWKKLDLVSCLTWKNIKVTFIW